MNHGELHYGRYIQALSLRKPRSRTTSKLVLLKSEHVLVRFWSQRGHGYPKPEKLQVFGRSLSISHSGRKQFSRAGGKQRET